MKIRLIKWVIGTLIISLGLLVPFRPAPPEPLIVHAEVKPEPIKAIECEKNLTIDQCRIRERIRTEFSEYPSFVETIRCESGFRQFKADGSVVRSHTDDVGVTQINVPHWGEKAKELGYDIYTEDGNLLMAKHVLKVQGLRAWVCYNNLAGGR